MLELTQTLVFGVLIGGVYALMATGLTLTFGVMKIVNMAQGAFLILAAYLCYGLWSRFGIDPILGAFIVTVPLAVLGVALYKLVIQRVQRIDHGLTIVATFALAIIAEACIALAWGPNPTGTTPRYFNEAFRLGSLVIPRAQLYACLLALGVTVALALHRQRRGRRLGLSLLLLAWAMPSVVTAKLYEWLYHPAAGLVSVLLGGHALNWLGDPYLALPAVILADVWRTMPFVAILCYARLVTIPAEVYEAAQVDGAGRLATLGRITLPLLGRIVMLALLLRMLDALRAFDIMFVLTGGGPAGTTETLTVYAYRSLFQMLQLGFGSAVSVVVFALVMGVAWAYLRLLRARAVVA